MTNPVYDNIGFWVPGVNYGGGGSTTLTAELIRAEMGKNFVIGKSSINDRPILARAIGATGALTLFEIDGVTAIADGSTFKPLDGIADKNGKNFVIGKSSIDGRALIGRGDATTGALSIFEINGVTPVIDASAFQPAGSDKVTVLPNAAADLVEAFQYRGTLAPASFNRAALLALSGGTKIIALSATVASGTADFTQGGSIQNLPASAMILHEYMPGIAMTDFTLNVDASSSVLIELTAV